jgi:hypothetical protein
MNRLFLLSALWTCWAAASPFMVSDPYPVGGTQPTHCGVFLNAAPRVEIAVALKAENRPYCRYDLVGVAVGSHTIRMTHVAKDTIWGDLESAQSVPFTFSRPGTPGVPTGPALSK